MGVLALRKIPNKVAMIKETGTNRKMRHLMITCLKRWTMEG